MPSCTPKGRIKYYLGVDIIILSVLLQGFSQDLNDRQAE